VIDLPPRAVGVASDAGTIQQRPDLTTMELIHEAS
jgi:hypothetical protein